MAKASLSSSGLGTSTPPSEGTSSRAPDMMGRYAPVARLGKGGMADVFLTVAHGLQGVNKLAVVKRLRNAHDLALTEMFLDEARLAARLNHPNIVHTYEVGEVDDEYFIAMEYLEGQPLSRVLRTLDERCEGLREPLVAFIAIQALKGLHHAHEFCDFDGEPMGVVHRDVSPHNLFLTYSGEIKLLDFGIAKATLNATHTEDGVLKGKVRYMAPEQATQSDLDRRVDLFAFGVVLWEMLARRALFTGAPLSILTRIINEEIPPVRGVRPDVSPALEAIALKAARRNRDERYATAEEMRLDLEAYLQERRDGVSERDLARVMNDMFASIREEVRSRVKAYVATMPAHRALLPSSAGMTSTGKLPVLPSWGAPPSAPSWPSPPLSDPASQSSEPSLASPPRSRWPRALAVALLSVMVTIVLFWKPSLRWSAGPPVSTPAIAAPVEATAAYVATTATSPPRPAPSAVGAAPPSETASASSAQSATAPQGQHHAHHPAATPAALPAATAPAPSASAPQRPNIRMLDDSTP